MTFSAEICIRYRTARDIPAWRGEPWRTIMKTGGVQRLTIELPGKPDLYIAPLRDLEGIRLKDCER